MTYLRLDIYESEGFQIVPHHPFRSGVLTKCLQRTTKVKTPEVALAPVGKEGGPAQLNDLTTLFDVIEFSDGLGMVQGR
jgi:hypothetical protein